jgi:hypothetical protein
MAYEKSPELKPYPIKDFRMGYNSFSASKTLIKDGEIPYGKNVWPDDVGSVTKRPGSSRYGGEIINGKVPRNAAQFRTTGVNELIVACGTLWKKKNGSSWDTIAGLTFTDDQEWDFCQTVGTTATSRLYGCNGTDKLAYYNGSTLVEQTTSGNVGNQVVAFNGRLYMTNSTYPDRIYYSNPYSYAAATAAFDISDFGTFNTDLTSTPKKNAGYLMLDPGAGLTIKKIKVFSSSGSSADSLYVWTDRNLWKIVPVSTALSDGSIAHTIQVIVDSKGTTSPKSVIQVGNDVKFYDYDNIYSLGEQAQYQNVRISALSGRIKSEIDAVSVTGKPKVTMGFFKDRMWFAYQKGTYNDRVNVWDSRLNAWSPPFEGLNIGWFLDFVESDGTHRWLAGSSSESYVYELQTGTDDNGVAISAEFETKSLDHGLPGIIKRYAFADVFYGMLYGTLSYEVFVDEVSSITGQIQLGNSTSVPSGAGTQVMGTFLTGVEYDPNTTFSDLRQNSSFRIDLGYETGKRISIRFTNNERGEQFTINSIIVYALPGDVMEG